MVGQNVKVTFEHAETLYEAAREEWSRPEEDVVPYMICNNLYEAVHTYLTAYLMHKGQEVPEHMSVQQLLDLVKKLNPRFDELILDPMFKINTTDEDYMDMKTVSRFIDMAKKTRELVSRG